MRDFIDIPFGHRFIGYWEQEIVKSRKEIIRVIEEHLSIDNIALSVSTYMNGKPYLLFMPFDFDSKGDIRKAWDDAKRLYNYFVREKIGAYLSFSGNKGFHVLVLTEPKIYTRKQLKISQRHYKKLLSLNTVDEQIFGDVRRLMRIPGTYNINGDLCRILAYNIGKELDLDEIYEDNELPTEIPSRNINKQSNYHSYPCIEKLVKIDSEPRHLIRFTYAILRLSDGWDYDKILEEIQSFGWIDFNFDYTLRQLEHIESRGYVPPSCNTLKELGFCCVENCEHKKSEGYILRKTGII